MSAALMTRAMRCSALASSSPSSSSRRHAAGPALPASSGCASMRSLRRSGSNSNAFVASSSSTTNRRSLRPVAALATDGKPAVVKVCLVLVEFCFKNWRKKQANIESCGSDGSMESQRTKGKKKHSVAENEKKRIERRRGFFETR